MYEQERSRTQTCLMPVDMWHAALHFDGGWSAAIAMLLSSTFPVSGQGRRHPAGLNRAEIHREYDRPASSRQGVSHHV
jgi:hypothetical protein